MDYEAFYYNIAQISTGTWRNGNILEGLSYEIDFENVDENW
jgi:hypothetical protein